MHTHFPYILFSNNELEVIYTQQDHDDFLHSLNAEQQQNCIILNNRSEYVDLAFNVIVPLSSDELAQRITQYLAQEGHCCLTKISHLTPSQAFDLLEIK